MRRHLLAYLTVLAATAVMAQPKFSLPHGLYDENSIHVTITPTDASAVVYYTTDGSTPTSGSTRYASPLTLSKTTLLRAIEVIDGKASAITTASYIFINSVLSQPNNPEGYPAEWGKYAQINGRAIADYEMDPEMTNDPVLRPKIIEGLKQIPILSVVTDKDNLFSHENNEETGGIYIFTGPPVGDNTGNGWTRQCSAELIGGPQGHNLTIDCGLKLHGGHGRLAEKNPKHSFRLQFKEVYGAKSLNYPIFGEDEPQKFDQLVLRCHFGNAWQHWGEGNRQKAQYTRDVWARRMQRKIGHTSVNALYVHLFLNGMYWGLYNLAERVDDTFGKNHLGGKKSDIDVIKIEEEGGNHIEASEGSLDAWNEMLETVYAVAGRSGNLSPEAAYEKLDTLLDKDNFIDYMLINQYAGNTDWDHHNWYAIRRNNNHEGFKFMCWDSEIIFENPQENVVTKLNGYPTTIFNLLLNNEDFALRYVRRAKKLLADDGLLGEQSVVQVWDSLYNNISTALYDEAARWGDYRRDVHRWQDKSNTVYTVDDNGSGADAAPVDKVVNPEWNMKQDVSNGGVVAGFSSVEPLLYADISQYDKLVIRGKGGSLRILANRDHETREWKEIAPSFSDTNPYWDNEYEALVIPLADFKNKNTSSENQRIDSYVHLNAIKANWGNTVNVQGVYLIPAGSTDMAVIKGNNSDDERWYNLQGQPVVNPTKGIYIRKGKKIVVR